MDIKLFTEKIYTFSLTLTDSLQLSQRVVLGKGEVGDYSRPHLKIRPHPKNFKALIKRP